MFAGSEYRDTPQKLPQISTTVQCTPYCQPWHVNLMLCSHTCRRNRRAVEWLVKQAESTFLEMPHAKRRSRC